MSRDPSICPKCGQKGDWIAYLNQWECKPCWLYWHNTPDQEREQQRRARAEADQDAVDRQRDAAWEATL